ncbi:MAG: beta-ketoacyl-[acyl-carrier-protein] synthase family protein [Desulfobacteraceae bacterium]|nr:beta-ketoacyl-[acyl-carrier-protein] synthase family protein [Desulfobacteraceae bacterium]
MDVAVTGISCICALGTTLDQGMKNMFENVPVPSPPKQFSTDHPIKYPVFSIPDSENSNARGSHYGQADYGKSEPVNKWVSKKNLDLTLTARMAIAAAAQALEDAGITPEVLKYKRVGVCMGTTVGCALNNDPFYIKYKQGNQPGMAPIKRFLASNPTESIAEEFDLDGPTQTIVNACASGTDAIGIGAQWLAADLCDLVIAGGTDELCKVTYNGFISLMITDDTTCKPFDADRNGLNLGEGAAIVILEPIKKTPPLKDRAKCRVAGYGSACDAYHLTAPKPDGQGLKTAINQALAHSGLAKTDIGFINAHGTGTRDNDKIEMRVFKQLMPDTAFFSTKGYTGHTLGAAGAIEAVFTIYNLINGIIPKSLGFSKKDPETDIAPVTKTQTISCRAAMSQSVAFGGNNSVLIFSLP